MKLENYLSDDNLFIRPEVQSIDEVFIKLSQNLATTAAAKQAKLDDTAILQRIKERENQGLTLISDELVFPHVRIKGLNDFIISVAVLKNPIAYGNSRNVKCVCMVLVPDSRPGIVLKMFALLMKIFANPQHISAIDGFHNCGEFIQYIKNQDCDLDVILYAEDLMEKRFDSLSPGQPLAAAISTMCEKSETILPVVDNDGKFLGEINTEKLFLLGMPEFFKMLKSVSFVADFDPLENYYDRESKSLVKDVINLDCCVFTAQNTILEIFYAMGVKKCQKVYIVDDNNKLIGIIDQTMMLVNIFAL